MKQSTDEMTTRNRKVNKKLDILITLFCYQEKKTSKKFKLNVIMKWPKPSKINYGKFSFPTDLGHKVMATEVITLGVLNMSQGN
jgi:hypothetical protein